MKNAREISGELLESVKDRFWTKVVPDTAAGCWNWKGTRAPEGYGRIKFGGRYWVASRVALSLVGRKVPTNRHVCHHCDNPPCVNPIHLFLGTEADNTADRVSKGRILQRKGASNPRARLTEEQVREIRSSDASYGKIAKRYGVSKSTVRDIRRGINWSHVQ